MTKKIAFIGKEPGKRKEMSDTLSNKICFANSLPFFPIEEAKEKLRKRKYMREYLEIENVKKFIQERLRAFADCLCCRNNTEEKVRLAIIEEIKITREKAGKDLIR